MYSFLNRLPIYKTKRDILISKTTHVRTFEENVWLHEKMVEENIVYIIILYNYIIWRNKKYLINRFEFVFIRELIFDGKNGLKTI